MLDEIACPVACGWLAADEVIAALHARPPDVHVVLTGRGAVPALSGCAGPVTEMAEVRHPYRWGVRAQPGLDF